MQPLGSSYMAFSWFIFRFLCILCFVTAMTSYKVNDRSSSENRNERAVTEWRFRRHFLLGHPYFLPNYARKNRLVNNNPDDQNRFDEMKSIEKQKFVIPQLPHPRDNQMEK